jgi:hypothetical protein
MSLEFFGGFDQGEAMSAASLEALRERMKAAAAQIKAIQKEEKKQKIKEDKLLKILMHFVKTSHKTELVLMISRCLELNIPANFILAIILLGNEDVQQALGKMRRLAQNGELGQPALKESDHGPQEQNPQALVFFDPTDESLPLKIKIELDAWIKDILAAADEYPQKLLNRAYKIDYIEKPREFEFDEKEYDKKRSVQPNLVRLMAVVMRDFLEQSKLEEPFSKIENFCEFILSGILTKTEENLSARKMLE